MPKLALKLMGLRCQNTFLYVVLEVFILIQYSLEVSVE